VEGKEHQVSGRSATNANANARRGRRTVELAPAMDSSAVPAAADAAGCISLSTMVTIHPSDQPD